MRKIISFLRAQEGADRAAFRERMRTKDIPSAIAGPDGVRRVVVNAVDVQPASIAWQRPGEQPQPAIQPFDVVAETWITDAAVAARIAAALAALPGVGSAHSYLCTETVEKDEGPTGVKYIAQVHFHDDLPDAAAKRCWTQHVPLALRVHAGMSRYVRNWVDAAISDDAPRIQGVVELHFSTMADMQDRWFVDERGRAEIIQDVGHFLKGATRMYCTEHRVKG